MMSLEVFAGAANTLNQHARREIALQAGKVEVFLTRLGHAQLVFPKDGNTLSKRKWHDLRDHNPLACVAQFVLQCPGSYKTDVEKLSAVALRTRLLDQSCTGFVGANLHDGFGFRFDKLRSPSCAEGPLTAANWPIRISRSVTPFSACARQDANTKTSVANFWDSIMLRAIRR